MTVLLIAGHGKNRNGSFDSGATGLISKGEHRYVTEDLFPAMKRHLPKNADVVFHTAYNVYDYGNIVSLAKKHGNDTKVVEVHFDAFKGTSNGGHVIVHKKYEPDALDLRLRDAINSMVGLRFSHKGHQGISGRDNLANVNRTANGGVNYRLIELGFGDNNPDADILINRVDEYAQKLVQAIFQDSKKDVAKPKPKPAPAKPKTTKKTYKVTVDGYLGPETVKALQRYFGLVVDGEMWGQYRGNQATKAFNQRAVKYGKGGSPVVKALQKKIGVTADGYWGANTTRALQRYLGTPVDGEIWRPSSAIKELQRRLNAGTF